VKRRPGQKARIDWSAQPLGRVPDAELARQLGVVPSVVRGARARRRIGRAPPSGPHVGVRWDEQPLGKMTDGELARRLGVNATSVRAARLRRRIPACSESPLEVLRRQHEEERARMAEAMRRLARAARPGWTTWGAEAPEEAA
jgi:hypothetical protein